MVQGRHVTWSVAIVGAGPAGSYLAQLLAKSGASVLLLDTACREKPYLETLSSRARPMHGVPAGASPCASNLSCWGGPEPVERAGILRPWGHDWFVDRSVFDAELRDNAIAAGATCWRAGARRADSSRCRTATPRAAPRNAGTARRVPRPAVPEGGSAYRTAGKKLFAAWKSGP